MLLIHQAGSVKVGEVVRYTITYTPSADRILPTPTHLYLRIKNTSAIPLRAAYLHGPYTIHVCAYPSSFNPNQKLQAPKREGVPEFEPNLKAGGHWHAKLTIPEDIRERGDKADLAKNPDGSPKSLKWIVEVASQILFSSSASVNYELLLSRDERSLELGFAAVASKGHGEPGRLSDLKQDTNSARARGYTKGVYSKAIKLVVEDTATLWNKPALPQWGDEPSQLTTDEQNSKDAKKQQSNEKSGSRRLSKPKKLHLVVLTHGLHSNIGADMLYIKESIDAAAKEAREAARERRLKRKNEHKVEPKEQSSEDYNDLEKRATAPLTGGQDGLKDDELDHDDSDDEQVIVRGFPGNACRTDRGVQYLGKRLAKFVLSTTYPDQPYLPATKSKNFTGGLFGSSSEKSNKYGTPAHAGSSIHKKEPKEQLPYTFTKISFIGHSLGGVVQTYAIAYIQKHSPEFFQKIKPHNFIAMASPFLGLSNENPLYVKFALDFGLVGRTGQDLGLTWRAPNIARTGWSALMSGFGSGNQHNEAKEKDPRAKPLLRILPTGPAHQVLKMFQNRTCYSNVVNDGIVPLRTSCLLFLDWHGLDKVDNARRENGLIGTMAAFGWAELTGANSVPVRPATASTSDENDSSGTSSRQPPSREGRPKLNRLDTDVPLPDDYQVQDAGNAAAEPLPRQFLGAPPSDARSQSTDGRLQDNEEMSELSRTYTLPENPITDFINMLRPSPGKAHPSHPQRLSNKMAKTYRRAQTIKNGGGLGDSDAGTASEPELRRPLVSRGDSIEQDPTKMPPPKTSIFDSASDILNPPLPPQSWLIDPTKRDRTIFHDRVYHADDIPPPQLKRQRSRTLSRINSSSSFMSQSTVDGQPSEVPDMKVEEKIARAYHNGMSWRKVLVRLEPDAHNNMIVRRIFANAYGWDVVKHLCDTHFADTYSSNTKDEDEANIDRAHPIDKAVTKDGEEVKGQTSKTAVDSKKGRTYSENQEIADDVPALSRTKTETSILSSALNSHPTLKTKDSVVWSDSVFEDTEDDDSEEESRGPFEVLQRLWNRSQKSSRQTAPEVTEKSFPERKSSLITPQSPLEAHRGIGVMEKPTLPPLSHISATDADSREPLTAGTIRPDSLDDSPISTRSFRSFGSVGGTTAVGLKKPPEAHVASPTAGDSKASIAEQIARSNTDSQDK